MTKIEEAKDILKSIGMPAAQQNELSALVLLAMANLSESDKWLFAQTIWIRIHDIISFVNGDYGKTYAENSRETFRKQVIHHFRNAAIIEDNGRATNSPLFRYRLTPEFLSLIKDYGLDNWKDSLNKFTEKHESLISKYTSKREIAKIPVKINGKDLLFSPGKHNLLQKAIIEEFATRFAPSSEVLYVGDTTNKAMVLEDEKLQELGFTVIVHDKMPDVVLFLKEKNWLYFVEAVASVGPISPKRILEIEEMTKNVRAEKIYVTAFPDFSEYKKFSTELAWETEVWISDFPDHMIHLNGDKFLGPRNP